MSHVLTLSGLSQPRDTALGDLKLKRAVDAKSDLLIVGSSRIYRHLNSELIESELDEQLSVYNLGIPGMWPPRQSVYLDRVLEQTSPRVLVVELNPPKSLAGNIRSSATQRSLNLRTVRDSIFTRLESMGSTKDKNRLLASFGAATIYRCLGIGLFRAQFCQHDGQESQDALRFANASTGGFLSLDLQEKMGAKKIPKHGQLGSILKKRKAEDLEKYETNFSASSTMLARCREWIGHADDKDCRLIFVLSPRLGKSDLQVVYPVFQQLPKTNKIDMSNPQEFPEFFEPRYSFDKGHLNAAGAQIFSKVFSAKLGELLEN